MFLITLVIINMSINNGCETSTGTSALCECHFPCDRHNAITRCLLHV